mgnify:CR=1 FL=1
MDQFVFGYGIQKLSQQLTGKTPLLTVRLQPEKVEAKALNMAIKAKEF